MTDGTHPVLGTDFRAPAPKGMDTAYFGMGCFWGAEEVMWKTKGVHTTSVGFMGNPKTEVVKVVYNPTIVSYDYLLSLFWSNHDFKAVKANPIYRSSLFVSQNQKISAINSLKKYDKATTQIVAIADYELADDKHQQYIAKHRKSSCRS